MDEKVYVESASYNDSAIFQMLNASAQINKKLMNGIAKGVNVSKEMIVEYSTLEASRSPMTSLSLSEYNNGKIVLKYYKPPTPADALPKALPFVAISGQTEPIGVVFVAPFSTDANEDQISIPTRKLSALMAGASVSRQFYLRPEKFSSNSSLISWTTDAYANIMVQLLKTDCSIEPGDEMNTALYIFARFVVSAKTMLPVSSPDLQHTYAKRVCTGTTDLWETEVRALWDRLPHDNIINLLTGFLKDNPKLKMLTAPYIMQKWIHRFGDLSAMALDQFPYFFMMIFSSQILANLTKDSSVKAVTRNIPRIAQLEAEMRRVLS